MAKYLVEVFQPRLRECDADAVCARLGRATEELLGEGVPVGYVRSIFVPEDESSFHLLEGPSPAAVEELSRRASLRPERIVEAVQGQAWPTGHGLEREGS